MNDERVLFDRAARPMRPEFRAKLEDLFELLESDRTTEPYAERPPSVVIELAPRKPQAQRPRHRMWLLMAASLVVVVAGLAALTRSNGPGTGVGNPDTRIETDSTIGTAAACAASTALGQVSVGTGLVLVSSVDDGRFCLEFAQRQLAIGTTATTAELSDPTYRLADSGPIGQTGGYYYVFAIPENLPVNVVLNEFGEQAEIFLNPVGRRLLIVEADVDVDGAHVTRTWELRTDGDGVFGRLSASGPLPRSSTGDETGATS
jgi:hypothetical protein